MAHSLSAKKRIRQNAKRRVMNRARVRSVRTHVKKLEGMLQPAADVAQVEKELKLTQKKIDQLVAKGSMHKNTAARKKAQLTKKLNAIKAAK